MTRTDRDHPFIDAVFDRLEKASHVASAVTAGVLRSARHGAKRTVELMEATATAMEGTLEELDKPQEVKPHAPRRNEDGILKDDAFDFLDRPQAPEDDTPK